MRRIAEKIWNIERIQQMVKNLCYVHFVMNSVSYIDGKMFGGSHAEMYFFLEHIKSITGDKSWVVKYGSDKDKHD